MKRPGAVALVALIAIGAGCGHKGWTANESGRVTLYTDARLEHKLIQQWLEMSHDAYRALFPEISFEKIDALWLQTRPGEGTHVFGPNEDPAFGWTLETVPSRGAIGKHGLIVLERRLSLGGSTLGIRDENLAKRQMAHLFIMKAAGANAPLWLQIGLARYMAKFRMHGSEGRWVVCFGGPAFDEPITAGGGGRRVTIPIHDLIHADWYQYERNRRYWFEYTAYALVHYLIHGENGFHQTRFGNFLRAIREGKQTEEALALAYPNVLENEWDERLAVYVRPRLNRAIVANAPNIAQGLCHTLPGDYSADIRVRDRPADPNAVATVLNDLQRVDLFRKHAGFMPADVVDAEASKRPGRGRGPAAPAGTGTGDEQQPAQGDPVIIRGQ